MQSTLNHIAEIVRPALRNYLASEMKLTEALESKDSVAIETARQYVMLSARQATKELHHLADFVLKEPSHAMSFAKIEDVRAAVEAKCVFLRTANYPIADVALLRDVADAFKHHRLDRPNTKVSVSTDVVPTGGGYGELHYGEGKYGGGEQVIITLKDGNKRALSSVLQNVFDAWMTFLGQPVMPISQY